MIEILKRHRIYSLAVGFAGVVIAWFIFARFLVPVIIQHAYKGESLPILNDMISGQAINPVEYYLVKWETFSYSVLGMLLIVGLIPVPLVVTRPESQRYLQAWFGTSKAPNPLVINTTLALIAFALVFYLNFFHPVGYVYLIAEDYWAEYASFVSWAMASCFFSWVLFIDPNTRRLGLVLITLGAYFMAMEEISWGQRILGFSSPALFAEFNVQRETNLHNLLDIGKQYTVAGIAIFLWSILLPPLRGKWEILRVWCSKLGIPIVPIHLWPFFLIAIFCFLYGPFPRYDEVGELFLAIAIAALSFDLVLTKRQASRVTAVPAIAIMLLTLGILTAFLVQFYSSPHNIRYYLHRFATDYLPQWRMHQQADMLFDYINRHPKFVTAESHFRQGVLLREMGRNHKSKQILELALVEQKRRQRQQPQSAKSYRIAGQVLRLLEHHEEATMAFQEAIKKDQTRLQQLKDTAEETRVRWSLSKTLLAFGDRAAALEQLLIASELASDPSMQFKITSWMQENFSKDILTKPQGVAN